jgi:hypothetical protein
LIAAKRAMTTGAPVDRASVAASIQASAEQIRVLSATGRAAAHAMMRQMSQAPTGGASEAQALIARVQSLFQTYDASFDRELAIAGEFQAIAVLMRDPRDFATVEPEIDRHGDTFGALDAERLTDAQLRQSLLAR